MVYKLTTSALAFSWRDIQNTTYTSKAYSSRFENKRDNSNDEEQKMNGKYLVKFHLKWIYIFNYSSISVYE